jgi:hypothetical protein
MHLLHGRAWRLLAVVGLSAWLAACGGDTDGGLCSVSSNLPNVSVGINTGNCDDAPSLSKSNEAVPAK